MGSVVLALAAPGSASASRILRLSVGVVHPGSSCPWVAQARDHTASPPVLAHEVLTHLSLVQRLSLVTLQTYPPLENADVGIAALCIPPLTLTDGPDGVANGLTGVTQFPSSLNVGATFSPRLAWQQGQAIAEEARAKGIEGVQGPNLNLVRAPLSGRAFETYGEDPYLTATLGVADVRGIQSTGEIADAKHFTAYTQENARARLNQSVSARALAELYDAPFRAVIQQGHVASLMCAYGSLNGVNTCSDPTLYRTLRSWGFRGFVRTDLRAATGPGAALRAGADLIKPASVRELLHLWHLHRFSLRQLDRAVTAVLTTMFAYGIVTHPLVPDLGLAVSTPAHRRVALRVAEASMTLLANDGVLPLPSHPGSVAVIGLPASALPITGGSGSAGVVPGPVVTPLAALRSQLARGTLIRYAPGGISAFSLTRLDDVTIERGSPLRLVTRPHHRGEPGKSDVAIERGGNVTPAAATADRPGRGRDWSSWSIRFHVRRTGTYELALEQLGDTWLSLGRHVVLFSPGLHARQVISATVPLVAGHHYTLSARWFAVRNHPVPALDIFDTTPAIDAAVTAARHARIAIVFAGVATGEGADRNSLALPGDQNALIRAVAAANPRTVVVLETGGAVLMPWIHRVAAVLEAWYPGQVDGAAIVPVLEGRIDPAGHLPLTFPASARATPITDAAQYPGVNATVTLGTGNGLDIGYRWYQAHHVRPLFPFGFGLSYTHFRLAGAHLRRSRDRVAVSLTVRNLGPRIGTALVQAYVAYPPALGEPPEQLRAFSRVRLPAGAHRHVTLVLAASAFASFHRGRLAVAAGTYHVDVGQSSARLPIQLRVTWPGPVVRGAAGPA